MQVNVSEDYVEPLDHVIGETSSPSQERGGNSKSTSFKAGLASSSSPDINEDSVDGDNDDDAAYNEIIENYNAPYYYSDTIKQEPTYCSPCSTWNNQHSKSCVNLVTSSSVDNHTQQSNSPHPHPSNSTTTLSSQTEYKSTSPHCHHHSVVVVGESSPHPPSTHHHHELPIPSCSGGGGAYMARKRYETAFLPSSSHHPSQSSSPDVDYLLLGIESSCSFVDGPRKDHDHVHLEGTSTGSNGELRKESGWSSSRVEVEPSLSRLESDPSMSYRQQNSNSHSQQSHCSVPQHHISGSTTTNSSPLSDKKPKPNMPLSEPLPQKKYANNNNNSNGSSSCSSSSPSTSASLSSCRPSDKRLLLTMLKDNSVSSLESIDSTKSEDLHSFSRHFGGHNRGGGGGSHNCGGAFGRGGGNCKLLSPISDKSPLESISAQHQTSSSGGVGSAVSEHQSHHQSHHLEKPWPGHHHHHHHHHHNQIINTAELTNVPWDMPKIRRRLALLADSGISLDCSGNTQSESGQFSSSDNERRSFDDSNFQYTSRTHIRGSSDLRVTGDSSMEKSSGGGDSGRCSRVHNLQLNLTDNGMMQDEYYEDPRLNVTELVPTKLKLPWMTNVTSVQVHEVEEQPPQPPPKPDRCRMRLDFGNARNNTPSNRYEIDPSIELEGQEWFHGKAFS